MGHRGLKWRALAGLTLATAVLAGCGGDDSDSALSKQELVARGDALCTEARQKLPPAPGARDLATSAAYTSRVDKVSTDILGRFRELEPRKGDRKLFDQFLAAAQERLKDVRRAHEAATAGDGRAVKAALGIEARQHAPRYRQLAQQLGFNVCGSGG